LLPPLSRHVSDDPGTAATGRSIASELRRLARGGPRAQLNAHDDVPSDIGTIVLDRHRIAVINRFPFAKCPEQA
jgi:hypothetical protein